MTGPLHGVRVWLSGAIPFEATGPQQAAIKKFVKDFARTVFRSGGHILHGSHPTLTPILLDAAKEHGWQAGARKDCLTLAVSRFWSKNNETADIQHWRDRCIVYETPEATTKSAEQDSLAKLREWMSERCDVFVAIGGNWWYESAGRAGLPIEAGLAIKRGLPCFLLGGLGGVAKDFVQARPDLMRALRNGLDEATNREIATNELVDDLVQTICTQMERLPLTHGRVSDGLSFRILALDGGGIKGAFTASVLTTLEKALGATVSQHFDLIVGTSTGGILALGLGLGIRPEKILEFYKNRGNVIFPMTHMAGRWGRTFRQFFYGPKHSQEVLLKELRTAYYPDGTTKTMRMSGSRLVIPAYDAISGVCHTFRTPHHELLGGDADTDIAEIALATAAAPTYYSAAKVKSLLADKSYFDGGVWANCPVMAGIVEAVCYLEVPLDRIDVLSIGTTDEPFTVDSFSKSGILGWRGTLIELLMNAQVDSSIDHAQRLIGDARFLRINATAAKGQYKLDDSTAVSKLIALGNTVASNPSMLSQVKSRFLNGISAADWTQQ
jgi:hypothetical protein